MLTGRSVKADEALSMGLINRVAAKGQVRETAEQLARDIAAFPQACMNADRMSAYQQWDLTLSEALVNEGQCAAPVLAAEGRQGAAAFAGGKGRHGSFQDA